MVMRNSARMAGLTLAVALACAPVADSHALSGADYGTSAPTSGLNLASVLVDQNMINSLSLAQGNGFNIQNLASASLGSMIGSAVTNAIGVDGVLGNIVQGVITAGVMQGMQQLSSGGSMGNFGGLLSASLNSVILNQMGIQGGVLSTTGSFGGLNLGTTGNTIVTAAVMGSVQAAANGASGQEILQTAATSAATAAAVGGIQGAVANTANLGQ